jgi:hypothetical protein
MLSLAGADLAVATIFLTMVICIVIAGAATAHVSKR